MDISATRTSTYAGSGWVRIIAAVGIIWYTFGLVQFWLGFSMDTTAAAQSGVITAAHSAAIDATPLLIWLAFALASGAGLAGSVFLFSGSAGAQQAFGVSLAAAGIYYAWVYAFSGSGAHRPSEEAVIAIIVVSVTMGFLLLSRRVT